MIKERFIELVDKYLSGTASANERQLVEEYLTRLGMNDYAIPGEDQEQKLKETMWQQIQLQTKQQAAQVVQMSWYKRKAFRSVAVAASVILVIGLGVLFITNNKPNQQAIVVKNDKRSDSSTLTSVHHEINTSGHEKKIVLEDGSEIMLADESELSYTVPFASNKRDISLTGKANFKVAKDKYRPFTVFSGDIATTALGTQFTVTSYVKDDHISVRLFEGRVVIKSIPQAALKMQNDYYLLPGNELIYDKQNSTALLRKFGQKDLVNKQREDVAVSKTNRDDPSLPKNKKGSWYMFNNQPLSEVFDQLGSMYNVEITYNKKEIANIYFIGSFEKTDSIGKILNKIAITNNLKITKAKEGNKYSLHK